MQHSFVILTSRLSLLNARTWTTPSSSIIYVNWCKQSEVRGVNKMNLSHALIKSNTFTLSALQPRTWQQILSLDAFRGNMMIFEFPYSLPDTPILCILPTACAHHITLSLNVWLPLRRLLSLRVFIHTACAHYYNDKSAEMSVNTKNVPCEIWLIGAISA